MRRTIGHGESGIRWTFTTKRDDLDLADDVALFSSTKEKILEKNPSKITGGGRKGRTYDQ